MKLLLSIILFCFCTACAEKEEAPPPPADLIPKEKMIAVLVDVNILEAALRLNLVRENKVSDSLFNYNVLKQHNVNRNQYQSSMNYYSRDPEEMTLMMDEVIAELSRRQAKVK